VENPLATWDRTFAAILPDGTRPRRVLLATLGFGEGHNRAAYALREILKAIRPGWETTLVDPVVDDSSGRWRRWRDRYYRTISRYPHGYQRVYGLLASGPWVEFPIARSLARWFRPRLEQWVPDLAVCTHVFCAWGFARASGPTGLPVAGMITDLVDDAYWNRTRLDGYLVGTDCLRRRLSAHGIADERIHVTGLPVDPAFFTPVEHHAARRRLGLAEERFTVLILGGGAGLGPVRDCTQHLAQSALPIQILVGTGRNAGLQQTVEEIASRSPVPVTAFPFTPRIHEYLDAADVVVTKPGGMTVGECLAKRVPIILVGEPLPGSEFQNAGYLEDAGLAARVEDAPALVDHVRTLVSGDNPCAAAGGPA
jgi:processive 1,2-diacylglycerol beta-glucosyltransferase